ncbi:MAG: recombinase family protein, partial [Anaerolineaceae bacterium]
KCPSLTRVGSVQEDVPIRTLGILVFAMTTAAIYTRVSVKDDTSTERQREACEAYCTAKGWEVGPIFEDRGISAYTGKDRPGWRKLAAAVEAREIDAVVVFAISRAARNTVALLQFAERCRERGVAFESVNEPIGGQYGKVFLAILGSLAELESGMKRDRVLAKHAQMDADGLWKGGVRPFGLDVIYTDDPASATRDARLVINAGEAEAIRAAAQDILRGVSLGTIMRRWNSESIRTSLGKQWRRQSLRQLFLRPTLTDPPAILTKRDADALRAMLEDPARHHPRRVDRYALTGVLVCGTCGGRMQGHRKRDERIYICRETGKVHMAVRADPVETAVLNAVITRAEEGVTLASVGDPAGVQGPILAAIDAVDEKLADFAENAALAGLPAGAIRSGSRALLAERERLEAELDAAKPPPPPTTWVESAPLIRARTQAELQALVEKVVIHRATAPRNVWNPDRVEIVWR